MCVVENNARPRVLSLPAMPALSFAMDCHILFDQLMGGTLAVESPVLEYMFERRLYGFGRQSRLDRAFMSASKRVPARWLILAGAAGLLGVVGVGVVAASERRRGGGRNYAVR